MPAAPSILVIDDEQGILETLRILLKNEGFDVTIAQGGKAGLEQLKNSAPDIVLTDLKMPGVTGIEILSAVRSQDPETPVILMTAQASLQTAIQAVNEGAFYYIQKPFSNDDMVAICRRAAEHRRLRAENKQLKQEIRRRERSGQVKPLGKSRLFSEVLRLAEQVAPTESTVLIQGESGTGKEVIARYLHELSARAEGQFLSLNCGALPESLLESELFGHVKGSFTGAVRDKQGLFAAARGGTFFLDEIGEMSPATQVKLLRVLQEREAIPVGGTEAIPVDVRVVAATNRDLEDDIKRGRFRSDLYYRLNVIAIELPPLRSRREDIPIFVKAFLERIAQEHGLEPKQLAPQAQEVIMAYDWPGNVRELEKALPRAADRARSGRGRPAGDRRAPAVPPVTRVHDRRPQRRRSLRRTREGHRTGRRVPVDPPRRRAAPGALSAGPPPAAGGAMGAGWDVGRRARDRRRAPPHGHRRGGGPRVVVGPPPAATVADASRGMRRRAVLPGSAHSVLQHPAHGAIPGAGLGRCAGDRPAAVRSREPGRRADPPGGRPGTRSRGHGAVSHRRRRARARYAACVGAASPLEGGNHLRRRLAGAPRGVAGGPALLEGSRATLVSTR